VTKSQRGGEERREWNRGGAQRPLAQEGELYLDSCVWAAEFLVAPLLMEPVCLFNQGRFEEPVRPCHWPFRQYRIILHGDRNTCASWLTYFRTSVAITSMYRSLRLLFERERERKHTDLFTYLFIVLYRLPATGSRASGTPCRQSAINDSLAPKPSPNRTLTLN